MDSTTNARTFYERAISMDPTQGRGFNQLAALTGDRNESLDAIYYYQRSLVSSCPYQHSLANLQKIYEKNSEKFESLKVSSRHLLEPSIREESRRMVLVNFIQLQRLLSPHDKGSSSGKVVGGGGGLTKLCERITTGLADCLNYDLILYQESCSDKVWAELGAELPQTPPIINLACFSDEDLLKLSALSILPSYCLRSLGSTHTAVASEFGLSVFSLFLSLSFKRVTCLLFSYIRDKITPEDVESMLQANASLTEILLRTESQQSSKLLPSSSINVMMESDKAGNVGREQSTAKPKPHRKPTTTMRKKAHQKVVDRRRRRGQRLSSGSSDSEGEEENAVGDSSSENSLSMPSDPDSGEDIQVLESLSESSASEDERQAQHANSSQATRQTTVNLTTADSVKPRTSGKRQIVLAASFNLAPSKDHPYTGDGSIKDSAASNDAPQVLAGVVGDDSDGMLREVYCEAVGSSCVRTACSILAEDSYLIPIKVFIQWLHTYPIVIAATSKQVSSLLWSNLASLLNLLPTEDQLVRSKFPLEKEGVKLGLAALPEEGILKGFPPLLEAQKKCSNVNLLRLEQSVSRVLTLLNFGHFISDLPMAPQFSWDSNIGKFVGPAQKSNMEEAESELARLEEEKQAKLTRSKLMKTMAQQRLKSEVASLAVAKANTSTLFTPYIIPDAHALCSGLHLIKKMIKSQKFLFIIPIAVIECLDQMKKGRDNYSAREAIKFLEGQLQSGNKFMKAQKPTETLMEGKTRKQAKMDIKSRWYQAVVDCGLYWSDHCGSEHSEATVTLLLDKQLVTLLKDTGRSKSEQQLEIIKMIEYGEERGLEIDSVLPFYSKWQQRQSLKK